MTEGRQVDLKRRVSSSWLNRFLHRWPSHSPRNHPPGQDCRRQQHKPGEKSSHHPQQRLHHINDWNQHNCPTSSYSFYFQTFSLFKKGMWTMIVHWQLLGCIIIIQQAPCFKLCLVLWKQQLRVLHHHQESQRSLTLMALCSEDLYTFLNSVLMSCRSSSDRVTMILVRVDSSVPQPWQQHTRAYTLL